MFPPPRSDSLVLLLCGRGRWRIPTIPIVTMSNCCRRRSGRSIHWREKRRMPDRQTVNARNRAQTLDNFRQQTRQDLDALNELTHLWRRPPGSIRCSSPATPQHHRRNRSGRLADQAAGRLAPIPGFLLLAAPAEKRGRRGLQHPVVTQRSGAMTITDRDRRALDHPGRRRCAVAGLIYWYSNSSSALPPAAPALEASALRWTASIVRKSAWRCCAGRLPRFPEKKPC